MDDAARRLHEQGLALFLQPPARARFRESLDDGRRRAKLRARLAHLGTLDARFATLVPTSQQDISTLLQELRRRGAGPTCYLVSEADELDARTLPLDEALDELGGSEWATFVSCLPGRLAYFHDELPNSRYILQRPD